MDLDAYKAGKEGCSLKCPLILGHACEHLMSLASKGHHDIAKSHPHEKTTKYWQEEMAAGGTFPLPPTDEDIELLSHCFQPEKRMPTVIKNKTGRKPRKKVRTSALLITRPRTTKADTDALSRCLKHGQTRRRSSAA